MPQVAVTHGLNARTDAYFAALRDAGLDPLSVTTAQPLESVQAVAGLVLCGGFDVDPSLYGQALDPRTGELDPQRDALELRLLRDALAHDLPVLAICRGLQLFNVAHAGTLGHLIDGHQVRDQDRSLPVHEAVIEPGSRLAEILGGGPHPVNSRHHQAADRVGEGLVVSARAPDGVIEGLERSDRRFAIAVQWHPEDQVRSDPAQRELFMKFAEAVARFRVS